MVHFAFTATDQRPGRENASVISGLRRGESPSTRIHQTAGVITQENPPAIASHDGRRRQPAPREYR
ncbi:hypothetical protein KCP76_23265 [Salmonella enterica subsp. enterica serovar Weltevreden]|nr:hypothetical protein KCP76_23265 [Salmonella enterica subsp. enterica serovar Weltevreden]